MCRAQLTNELIFSNLVLIHKAPNQCVIPSELIVRNGNESDLRDELINYLLLADLIENEYDDLHFYLTALGYEVINEGFWSDPKLVALPERRTIQDTYSSPVEKRPTAYRPSLRVQVFLFGGLLVF